MKKTLLLIVPVALFFLSSCASGSKVKAGRLYDCSSKLVEGIEKYKKKRFSSAQTLFSEIIQNCPGHSANDTTLYYLGKSWLALKKPDEAKLEFDHLVQMFPNSSFTEESRYLVGFTSYLASSPWYLDQTTTLEARNRLKSYIESNPGSPFTDSARVYILKCNDKLAEKQFQAARFYEKIDRYEAAIVYHKVVINDFPECSFVHLAKLSVSSDLIQLSRNTEATAVLDELLSETKDESIIKKAGMLKQKAAKKQL
jgi:outer membrane protein assembly factor BamD